MVDFSVLGCILVGFGVGWLFGSTYHADKMMRVNEAQRKRGDYWYDKYMREVEPNWEWIGEWKD